MSGRPEERTETKECPICAALVLPADAGRHADWHERLVDDVVTAVKVSLNDPPK